MSSAAAMFVALRVPNFRLYFAGQSVSLVGTWMQAVAQSWLVLQLSHSGTVLGLVVAAQFLPVLVAGPYGGLIADRANKHHLLMATQSALAMLAFCLGILTMTHVIQLWMVVIVAVGFGLVNAIDNPTRQTFVAELVGTETLRNAVSLNSVVTNAARAIGPATAGILIATVGVGVCFLVNAASFAAVLTALHFMHTALLSAPQPVARAPGQLLEGLRYVRGSPGLWTPLVMMALIGTLAYEFQVVLPLLAEQGLHGDARTYGFLTAAMGIGAVLGGLAIGAWGRAGVVPLLAGAALFALTLTTTAIVTTVPAELAALVGVGVGSTAFLATGNTTLQLVSDPHFRGRVMALWSVTFLGSTPVGGPVVGAIAQHFGARAGLAVGAGTCLIAVAVGVIVLPQIPQRHRIVDARALDPPNTSLPTEADRT